MRPLEQRESKIENKGGQVSYDNFDQKMLWESLFEKRSQLAVVKLEFDTRKHVELNRITEKLCTKKRVHSAEQKKGKILRAQEVASQELQRLIDAR